MNETLEKLLEKAANLPPMTADEVFERQVSWVYGQLAIDDPTVTKEDVRNRLEATR